LFLFCFPAVVHLGVRFLFVYLEIYRRLSVRTGGEGQHLFVLIILGRGSEVAGGAGGNDGYSINKCFDACK
jgi:hypothetical protein